MAEIYFINVGTNTSHCSKARGPLFSDGQFEFIPFPDPDGSFPYERQAWPFVRDSKSLRTHPDPDWGNLTYGDNCRNRRAKALLSVQPGDVLLFWGLLWKFERNGSIFDLDFGARRWCVFGALTVAYVVKAERGREVAVSDFVKDRPALQRAIKNAHVWNGKLCRVTSKRHDVLFVGDVARSGRFNRAVDLQIYRDGGLLQKTILSKGQRALQWDRSPRWNCSLRSCRAILDLSKEADRRRAEHLDSAIRAANHGFDVLASALAQA